MPESDTVGLVELLERLSNGIAHLGNNPEAREGLDDLLHRHIRQLFPTLTSMASSNGFQVVGTSYIPGQIYVGTKGEEGKRHALIIDADMKPHLWYFWLPDTLGVRRCLKREAPFDESLTRTEKRKRENTSIFMGLAGAVAAYFFVPSSQVETSLMYAGATGLGAMGVTYALFSKRKSLQSFNHVVATGVYALRELLPEGKNRGLMG